MRPFRIGDYFQRALETGVRFTNAIGILNNGLAVGEKAGHSEGHSNAMIAEAGQPGATQRSGSMYLEAVAHLDHLRAHGTKIMSDGGEAVGFLDSQLLRLADDGCSGGNGPSHREHWQFVDELWHFFSLNDSAFKRRAGDLDDAAGFELIDLFDGFTHLSSHSHQHTQQGRACVVQSD